MIMKTVTETAGIIILLSLGSRILGFLREIVFAAYLGVSPDLDSFLIAQIVPTVLGGLLYTSLLTAMIPLYSKSLATEGQEGGLFRARILTSSLLPPAIVISGVLYFASPFIISYIGYGLSHSGKSLAIMEMRLMLPCLIIFCLLAIINAYQQASYRFFFPYLGPVIFNLVIICGFFAYGRNLSTYEVSIIVTFATLCQLLVQIFGFKEGKFGFFLPNITLKTIPPDLVAFFVPAMLVTILNDIMPIIDKVLASSLNEGAVSTINYAHKINSIVASLITGSIASATYPAISASLINGHAEEVVDSLEQTIRLVAFAVFPFIGLMLSFPYELVAILFQRGAFDLTAVISTGAALYYLAFGIFAIGLISIFGQYYCLRRENRFLFLTTLIIIFSKLAFSYYFVNFTSQAVNGLALATSLSLSAGALVLFYGWFLENGPQRLNLKPLLTKLVLIFFAAAVATLFAKVSHPIMECLLSNHQLILAISCLVGLSSYYVIAQYFGCDEIMWFKRGLYGIVKAIEKR